VQSGHIDVPEKVIAEEGMKNGIVWEKIHSSIGHEIVSELTKV
jgi:hypothetical protein